MDSFDGNYAIIQVILKYLDFRDLVCLKRINKLWNAMCVREIDRRFLHIRNGGSFYSYKYDWFVGIQCNLCQKYREITQPSFSGICMNCKNKHRVAEMSPKGDSSKKFLPSNS